MTTSNQQKRTTVDTDSQQPTRRKPATNKNKRQLTPTTINRYPTTDIWQPETSNLQRHPTPTVNNNQYPTTDTWQPATSNLQQHPTPTVNNRYLITETWQPAINNSE
jgi:hypothetical protein